MTNSCLFNIIFLKASIKHIKHNFCSLNQKKTMKIRLKVSSNSYYIQVENYIPPKSEFA